MTSGHRRAESGRRIRARKFIARCRAPVSRGRRATNPVGGRPHRLELDLVAWQGGIRFEAEAVDAAVERPDIGEPVTGEVGGGVERARARVVVKDDGIALVPRGRTLPAGGPARRVARPGWRRPRTPRGCAGRRDAEAGLRPPPRRVGRRGQRVKSEHLLIVGMAGQEVIDHLLHRDVIVAETQFGQRFRRAETHNSNTRQCDTAQRGHASLPVTARWRPRSEYQESGVGRTWRLSSRRNESNLTTRLRPWRNRRRRPLSFPPTDE